MPRGYTKMMWGTAASTARISHRRKPWQQQASARILISELSVPTTSQKGKKGCCCNVFLNLAIDQYIIRTFGIITLKLLIVPQT